MKKRTGFTLAEVLITLTVIGVVAAITLPSINSNTGAARSRALLKKGISTLNNAVMMNVANNEWSFADITEGGLTDANCKTARPSESRSMCALLNEALVGETYTGQGDNLGIGYTRHRDLENIFTGSSGALIGYRLSDGILIGITGYTSDHTCTESDEGFADDCGGFIDINGPKGPNTIIQCKDPAETKLINDEDYTECEVANNPNADVFPFVFYDSTVELASNAAKAFFNQ